MKWVFFMLLYEKGGDIQNERYIYKGQEDGGVIPSNANVYTRIRDKKRRLLSTVT